MAEIRINRVPTPATLGGEQEHTPLIDPIIPSPAELRTRTQASQKALGIPTEDEYDPLLPGATDQELWPAQPGGAWIDFRVV